MAAVVENRRVPLSMLHPGQSARVTTVELNGKIGRRVRALGFVVGTNVTALRAAPLGDPTEYQVRGGRVSLRRTEARHILVDPAE